MAGTAKTRCYSRLKRVFSACLWPGGGCWSRAQAQRHRATSYVVSNTRPSFSRAFGCELGRENEMKRNTDALIKGEESPITRGKKRHSLVRLLLWAVALLVGGLIAFTAFALILDAVLSPETKARLEAEAAARKEAQQAQIAAEQELKTKAFEANLDQMVADQTLYLPKNQMKLMPHLKDGARQLLQSGKCDFITDASISEKSKAKDPLFYYHCGKPRDANFGSFRLTVSQIKNKALNIANPPEYGKAYIACEEFIRQRLNFPSTFDTNGFKTATRTFSDGRREITIEFTGKNAFGLELPGSARCLFVPKNGSYEMEGTIIAR